MKCRYHQTTVVKDGTGSQKYVDCCTRKWLFNELDGYEKVKNALGVTFVKCPMSMGCRYRQE